MRPTLSEDDAGGAFMLRVLGDSGYSHSQRERYPGERSHWVGNKNRDFDVVLSYDRGLVASFLRRGTEWEDWSKGEPPLKEVSARLLRSGEDLVARRLTPLFILAAIQSVCIQITWRLHARVLQRKGDRDRWFY